MQNDNNERPTVSSLKQLTIAIKDAKRDSSAHVEPHQAIIHLIDEKPVTRKVLVISSKLLSKHNMLHKLTCGITNCNKFQS